MSAMCSNVRDKGRECMAVAGPEPRSTPSPRWRSFLGGRIPSKQSPRPNATTPTPQTPAPPQSRLHTPTCTDSLAQSVRPDDFAHGSCVLGNEIERLERKVEGIGKKSDLWDSAPPVLQQILQVVTRIEREQHVGFGKLASLQEMFFSVWKPKTTFSLTDLDGLLKSHTLPLSMALDSILCNIQAHQSFNGQKPEDIQDAANVKGLGTVEQVTRADLSRELGVLQQSLLAGVSSYLSQSVVDLKKQQDTMMRELSSKMAMMEVSLESTSALVVRQQENVVAPQDEHSQPTNSDFPTKNGDVAAVVDDRRATFASEVTFSAIDLSAQEHPGTLQEGAPFETSKHEPSEKGMEHNITWKINNSVSALFGLDEDVEKPAYHVEDRYHTTGWPQHFARSRLFSQVTMVVVCLNAIWIGFEADCNSTKNLYSSPVIFQVGTQFFVAYFTAELLVRYLAFEKKMNAFRDSWFLFDLFLVTTMVLDVWVVMLISYVVSGGGKMLISTQPLRVLRLLKLSRMGRLMRAFPELVTMIRGLWRSLRAIFSTLILIMLMIYTWSIVLFMLLGDEEDLNKQFQDMAKMDFSSLTNSMWILMMGGVLSVDSSTEIITKLVYSKHFDTCFAGVAFLLFGLLANLLVLQMLIGVLCDLVTQVNNEQRRAQCIGLIKQELLSKLQEVDDGDGQISHEELKIVINDSKSKAVLKKLKINRLFLYQIQAMMFESPTSTVSIKAALDMMVMCKAENYVTVEMLAGGFCYVFQELEKIKRELAFQQHFELEKVQRAIVRLANASSGNL